MLWGMMTIVMSLIEMVSQFLMVFRHSMLSIVSESKVVRVLYDWLVSLGDIAMVVMVVLWVGVLDMGADKRVSNVMVLDELAIDVLERHQFWGMGMGMVGLDLVRVLRLVVSLVHFSDVGYMGTVGRDRGDLGVDLTVAWLVAGLAMHWDVVLLSLFLRWQIGRAHV